LSQAECAGITFGTMGKSKFRHNAGNFRQFLGSLGIIWVLAVFLAYFGIAPAGLWESIRHNWA
jgi:hypothetical protein